MRNHLLQKLDKRKALRQLFSKTKIKAIVYSCLLKLDSLNVTSYFDTGWEKYHTAKYKGIIASFDTAVKLNPDSITAYLKRGLAKLELNDLQGAMADFNKVISLDTTSAPGYFHRGQAWGP